MINLGSKEKERTMIVDDNIADDDNESMDQFLQGFNPDDHDIPPSV